MPVIPGQTQKRDFSDYVEQTQYSGNPLGNHRRDSCSCRSHMKYNDEYQIQHNIQQSRQNQKIQRHLAVSQCPQDACQKIIEHLGQYAGADNHNIRIGICKNIFRCMHQNKPRLHKHHKCRGKHQSHNQRQERSSHHGSAHGRHISGAEFLSGKHGKSCCHSNHESIDQKHDCPCASHGSQGFISHKFSYNYRIGHIIKLLKHISDENRQSKIKDNFHRTSCCHIRLNCFHSIFPRY